MLCKRRHADTPIRPYVSLGAATSPLYARRYTCEVIGGGNDTLARCEVPRVMSGLANNDKLATGPILRKSPWRDERGA